MKIGGVGRVVSVVEVDLSEVRFCWDDCLVVFGDRVCRMDRSGRSKMHDFFRSGKLRGSRSVGIEFLGDEVVGLFDPDRSCCSCDGVVEEIANLIGGVRWSGKVGVGAGGDKIGFFGEKLSGAACGGIWLIYRASWVRFGPALGIGGVSDDDGVYAVLWKGTRVKQLGCKDVFLDVLRGRLAGCKEKYLEMGRLLERSKSVLVEDLVLYLRRALEEVGYLEGGELAAAVFRGCVNMSRSVVVYDIVRMVAELDCVGSGEFAGELLKRLDFCPYCCRAF